MPEYKITIKLESDNDSASKDEICRILNHCIDIIVDAPACFTTVNLFDVNGNKVGIATFFIDEEVEDL
jgi:hypothetical protein